MNHLSLFSGIGGIDLAAQWAGIGTTVFCEKDKFCQRILRGNFGDNITLFDNIHTLTRISLDQKDVGQIEIITGGFPCQPFSDSGDKRGAADDRYLWPEMLRVIQECKPAWVIGENVRGLVNMDEFEIACSDLEKENYEVWPLLLPACAVGAPHQRQRIFILAHSQNNAATHKLPSANTHHSGLQGHRQLDECAGEFALRQRAWEESWIEAAPRLCVVDDGLSERVAKLQGCGNAVVPQQIYPILKGIALIEGIA